MRKKNIFYLDKTEKTVPTNKEENKKNTEENNPKKRTEKKEAPKKNKYELYHEIKNIAIIQSEKKPLRKHNFEKHTFDNILDDIKNGMSLVNACKNNKISYNTVTSWIAADPEREREMQRARTCRARMQIEMTIDIAHDAIAKADEDTKQATAQVNARKLLIETIYKNAAKLCPDEFGDRVRTDIGGVAGSPIASISITSEQLIQLQQAEKETLNKIAAKLID